MTYNEAFDRAVRLNAETGVRQKIYHFIWESEYVVIDYHLPIQSYAILVGEVGRMT